MGLPEYQQKIIKKYPAFTLIEILVVVGLIAILAAITILAINPSKMFSESRNVERWNGLRAISNGIEQLVIDSNGSTQILDGDGSDIPDCELSSSAIMDQPTVADAQVDIDGYLVDDYVVQVPRDPVGASGAYTGYRICKYSNSTRYLVFAPNAELDEVIELPTTGEYAILAEGLTGYWKMNETSWNGTPGEVTDSTSAGNGGYAVGNATPTSGQFGLAATLDGSGDYLFFGDQTEFDIQMPFTLSIWFKLDQLPSTAGRDFGVLTKYQAAPNRQWTVEIGSNDDLYFWKSHNGTNGQYVVYGYIVQPADVGVWKHAVITGESSGVTKLYVDGSVITTNNMVETTFVDRGTPMQIGRRNNSPYNYFDGMIDEVRIYNRALSQTEVQALYEYYPNE